MATATGKITVFGVNTTVALTGAGLLASGDMAHQSQSFDQEYETAELLNGVGEPIAKHYFAPKARLSIEFIPFDPANPGTLATMAAKIQPPAPGSTVAISGASVPLFDGNWNFTGQFSVRPNQRGFAIVSMQCERVGVDGNNKPVALLATGV